MTLQRILLSQQQPLSHTLLPLHHMVWFFSVMCKSNTYTANQNVAKHMRIGQKKYALHRMKKKITKRDEYEEELRH